MKFCGVVFDPASGQALVYPLPRGQNGGASSRYVLLVRVGDEGWRYCGGVDRRDTAMIRRIARRVEDCGFVWRIVEARTGEVVEKNPACFERLCWN
jgi:hypothetical protein